jgi:hypothetical protein
VDPPHLQHLRLDLRAHLMRAAGRPVRPVRQPLQPTRLIPGQPGMHALPGNTPTGPPPQSPCRPRRSPPGQPDTAAQPRSTPSCQGVSRISRSSRQGSAETLSAISRRPDANHQPS